MAELQIDISNEDIGCIQIDGDGLDDICFSFSSMSINMTHEQMEAFFNAMKPWFIE